jgi:hypothetical protein
LKFKKKKRTRNITITAATKRLRRPAANATEPNKDHVRRTKHVEASRPIKPPDAAKTEVIVVSIDDDIVGGGI